MHGRSLLPLARGDVLTPVCASAPSLVAAPLEKSES
jgi:hypothetical protein